MTRPLKFLPTTGPRAEQVAAAALARWRAIGGRGTPGRVAVLRTLATQSPAHLTASELRQLVNEAGWTADLSGVSRTLHDFTDAGLTHTLHSAGAMAYGLAYPPHHHALCQGCGRLGEIPPGVLTEAITVIQRTNDYQLLASGLTFHGLCQSCR